MRAIPEPLCSIVLFSKSHLLDRRLVEVGRTQPSEIGTTEEADDFIKNLAIVERSCWNKTLRENIIRGHDSDQITEKLLEQRNELVEQTEAETSALVWVI